MLFVPHFRANSGKIIELCFLSVQMGNAGQKMFSKGKTMKFFKQKYSLMFCICLIFLTSICQAKDYKINSPNMKIEVNIRVEKTVTYSVCVNSMSVLSDSPISMKTLNHGVLCIEPAIESVKTRTIDEKIYPTVREKTQVIADQFTEINISFKGNYGLIFRAYNDGVAYRFYTNLNGKVTIVSEQVAFNFANNYSGYFQSEDNFISHQEGVYKYRKLSSISANEMCFLPVLVDISSGPKLLITEADLYDYPGLWLKGDKCNGLQGKFPHYVLKEEMKNDRDPVITERADYIAITKGKRKFPWRVLLIAEKDGDLIESQLVYKLSQPLQLEDTSWIRPGKVAWDWYNANNLYGVDFRAGINTETYKYYIDFASKYGIEYVILDEGWYVLGDLLKTSKGMDIKQLVDYAKQKNVGIILWVIWKTLDDQLEEALDQFEKWGVVGIKVDFMQTDDQKMVNYYYKIAREAAERRLLVDYHGCFKPTGLRRAYPNVITREGVTGLESNKWKDTATPEHNVTMPFIRMVAGPIDYTPGSMVNAQKKNFNYVFDRPVSQGTRCHQLAMFVIYESPLQMLADSPSQYLREPECMEFLSKVPTVWDDTRVLDAKIGDYIAIARKSGNDWYLGVMTDWSPRDLTIDFSFLDSGKYEIVFYRDGINADRYASDYKKEKRTITNKDRIKITLAPGGGWAAQLRRK